MIPKLHFRPNDPELDIPIYLFINATNRNQRVIFEMQCAEFAEVTCSDKDKRTKMAFYHKIIWNRTECFTSEGISDKRNSASPSRPSQYFELLFSVLKSYCDIEMHTQNFWLVDPLFLLPGS